jgi:glycosyltransferase involved in cell wall biosynthesis
MNATPLVSVNMPVYNGAAFIGEAIRSILQQTYRNFELIVVNDGSTDATGHVIGEFKDQRIKLINRTENKGLAYSRNEALEHSTGKYVAILDSDDVALPDRLAEQVAFLEANPEYALAGTWVQPIDKNGNLSGEVWEYATTHEEISTGLLLYNQFAQPSVMLRREKVPHQAYHSDFPPAEDYELWTRIARDAKVANLPKVLTLYRLHGGNISKNKELWVRQLDSIIRRRQLQFLLADFAEADSRVYESLLKKENVVSPVQRKIGALIDKILIENEKKKIYHQPALVETFSPYWKNAIVNCSRYDLSLLRSYLKSEFRRTGILNANQRVRLIVKCLVGWNKSEANEDSFLYPYAK